MKCLKQLAEFCGNDKQVVVCRELTKFYEEVKRGTLEEVAAYFEKSTKVKGEIVMVVEGNK